MKEQNLWNETKQEDCWKKLICSINIKIYATAEIKFKKLNCKYRHDDKTSIIIYLIPKRF
jgi:hypothetical protein